MSVLAGVLVAVVERLSPGQGQWVAGSPSISPRKAPNSPTWVPSPRTSWATLPRPRRGLPADERVLADVVVGHGSLGRDHAEAVGVGGGVSPSAGGAVKSTAISPADRPADRTAVDLRTLEPPGVLALTGTNVRRRTGRTQAFPPRPNSKLERPKYTSTAALTAAPARPPSITSFLVVYSLTG